MIKNRKSDHVGIAVNDIKASSSWYIDILGYKLIGDFTCPDGTPVKFLQNQDVVFELFQPMTGVKEEVRGKIDHYAFYSKDIGEDYLFCKQQGYRFTTNGIQTIPTFWDHGIKFFKIASPTGEEMEFCQIL